MDRDTRNLLANTTQALRRGLEEEFARPPEDHSNALSNGTITPSPNCAISELHCKSLSTTIINQQLSPVSAEPKADVKVHSFEDLFHKAPYALSIDSYQRPFVWGEDKVFQLLSDLNEHTANAPSDLNYYMGTILLHRATEHLFVIDGQQRLTTLCLLYRHLLSQVPANCKLAYRSPESWRNIKRTAALFTASPDKIPLADIFRRILFTVITVNTEDLAFTFFDTQNNRGVPLAATDLLKAFHLRAIRGQDGASLALQKNCAGRWEGLQTTPPILGPGSDFAPSLFHFFLWRSRRWTGNLFDAHPSHDELIDEFQTRSLPPDPRTPASLDTVPLYSSRGNRRAAALTLAPLDGYRLSPEIIHLNSNPAELPFAVRQPISAGVGFFLYAEKYAFLTHQLLRADHEHPEVRAFRDFHDAVVSRISIYLRELFLLASVMFVDQFGYGRLFEFALWLDHALGALRIEKAYIFKEAPLNFLKQPPRNLLDVISSAFRAEEAIGFLRSLQKPIQIYASVAIERDGVQRNYEQCILTYYGRTGTLTSPRLKNRHTWVCQKLIEKEFA